MPVFPDVFHQLSPPTPIVPSGVTAFPNCNDTGRATMPCAAVQRKAPKLFDPLAAFPTMTEPSEDAARAMLPTLLPRSPRTWYLLVAVQRNASVLSEEVQVGGPLRQTHA